MGFLAPAQGVAAGHRHLTVCGIGGAVGGIQVLAGTAANVGRAGERRVAREAGVAARRIERIVLHACGCTSAPGVCRPKCTQQRHAMRSRALCHLLDGATRMRCPATRTRAQPMQEGSCALRSERRLLLRRVWIGGMSAKRSSASFVFCSTAAPPLLCSERIQGRQAFSARAQRQHQGRLEDLDRAL